MSKNGKLLIAAGLGAAILAAGVVVGVKYAREFLEDRKLNDNENDESDENLVCAESKNSGSKFIGEEKAKSIALNEAGLSDKEIESITVVLECEDGVWQYTVVFREDNTLLSYIINADNGSVLDWNADFED